MGPRPNYVQTTGRAKRRKRAGIDAAYMDRGSGVGRRGGAKRGAIVLGVAVIERIVNGQYRWRDANLAWGSKRARA